jgi:hypothetical protein
VWIAPIATKRPSFLLREWHLIEGSSHGRLTIDSLSEAKLFASLASSWIEYAGVHNSVFADYFGATQNNYTVQDGRFKVCSWLSYLRTLLTAP